MQEQFYLDIGEVRFDGEDYEERKLFAGGGDASGGRQSLDLLCRDVRVGGEESGSMEKMPRRPYDEGGYVVGDGCERRTIDVLEDCIEDGPRLLGEIEHERAEFTVEVAEEEQRLIVENGEARVVNCADDVFCLEEAGHHRWKIIRQRLCVCW